jgi:lipopolysaccharide export system protein LptC
VELRRGNDVFVGDTMDYDNLNQVMVMQGRVKGLINPKQAAGAGK